jgi:hypothetical protein
MNSQDVTNVATLGATTINATTVNATTLVPTNITGWGVKSIVAGTNVTVSNASGAVTINASAAAPTTVEANASYLINSIATLPSKPFWYGTAASFVNTGNTSSITQDAWVSATGQYQMFACGTTSGSVSQYNLYSSDWGVSYANGNILAMGSGVCGSHNGDIVYYCTRQAGGTGRIWKFNAASGGSMVTLWGQGFSDLSAPNVDWNKIACSRDGQYVLAGTYNTTGGLVYISTNGGSSWTYVALTTNTSQIIYGVAVSADGRYMYATTGENTNYIKYSSNYGVTWNTSSGSINNPVNICCSATGQIVACTSTNGFFSSWNFGQSFVNNNSGSSSATNITGCCMSANGQFVLKCYSTGKVGYSENFGRNWYPEVTLIGSTPDLNCIACSDTGGYVAIGPLAASRTYNLYDVPTDVRQLVAGTNIILANNGSGTYTITSTAPAPTSAYQHIACIYSMTAGTNYSLPTIDLQYYDYFFNFEMTNCYYDKSSFINFNNVNNPYNFNYEYYPTTQSGDSGIQHYSGASQASDGGVCPFFYSPNNGSFFLCNCNLTFKMSALRPDVTVMSQYGEPVYTHGEGAGYYGGKGTGGGLANWVGADARTIWGEFQTKTMRFYLPNNSSFGPTSIRVTTADTQGYWGCRLNIARIQKNINLI